MLIYYFILQKYVINVCFLYNLKSSDSEDDFEEDVDNKFKNTIDDSAYLGMSSQGSDSQQHNCDLQFQLKTLSSTPSCVIS